MVGPLGPVLGQARQIKQFRQPFGTDPDQDRIIPLDPTAVVIFQHPIQKDWLGANLLGQRPQAWSANPSRRRRIYGG